MMRLKFDTNLGTVNMTVRDEDVLTRMEQLLSLPGVSNLSSEMLDSPSDV